MNSPWPFVGREAAVTDIATRISEGPVGHGIMLQGPAGVGKSTLLNHVSRRLRELGHFPLHIHGSTAATAVPFGPFAPLFAEFGIAELEGFAALSALTVALRKRPPNAVLMVDDVARMDPGSILAVQQIVLSTGLKSILTVRGNEVPASIAQMCDQGFITVDQVPPLSAEDVHQIAADYLKGPLSPRTVVALIEHVEGNPLHLRELLLASRQEGALTWTGTFFDLTGGLALSPRIHELVGRRFDSLNSDELRVLELLAAGQPLPASGFDANLVERLERGGLLDHSAAGELRLAHPLYDDVLRTRTAPSWWRRSKGQAAQILRDSVRGKPADNPAVVETCHRAVVLESSAGTRGSPAELAATAAWAAGRSNPELAARLARQALEGGPLHLAHVVLGAAAATLGDLTEAETQLRAAMDTAVDDDDLARLAAPVGLFWGARRQDPERALKLLHELATRSASELPLPAIRSEIAIWLMMTGQSPGEMFSTDGDEIDRLSVAVNHAFTGVIAGPLHIVDTAVELGLPLAVSHREELPHALSSLRFSQVTGIALSGDLNRARAQAEEYLTESDTIGGETSGVWQQLLGLLELTQGNADLAHTLAIDAHRNLSWRDIGGVLTAAKALLFASAVQQGRPEAEINNARSEFPAGPPTDLRVTMLLGWAQARRLRDRGDIAGAAAHAVHVGTELISRHHVYLGAALLHVAVRLDHPEPAVELLRQVADTSGGGLLHLMHEHAIAVRDQDAEAMLSLAARMEQLGGVGLAADVATQVTHWFAAAGSPMPNPTWLQDLQVLRQRAGANGPWTAPVTLRTDPFALTERELKVAHLAADRLRSREIAQQLGIAIRTVDNHLQRIYRKLGVNDRTALAEALEDLLQPPQ